MWAGLSAPVQGVHFWKEAIIFKVPLILVMSVLELHVEL